MLIVTDPGVVETGWAQKVEAGLEAAGIAYVVYSEVTPNPKDHEVMAGAEICRSEACDLILAVGASILFGRLAKGGLVAVGMSEDRLRLDFPSEQAS